eukprot:Opistho-2@26561
MRLIKRHKMFAPTPSCSVCTLLLCSWENSFSRDSKTPPRVGRSTNSTAVISARPSSRSHEGRSPVVVGAANKASEPSERMAAILLAVASTKRRDTTACAPEDTDGTTMLPLERVRKFEEATPSITSTETPDFDADAEAILSPDETDALPSNLRATDPSASMITETSLAEKVTSARPPTEASITLPEDGKVGMVPDEVTSAPDSPIATEKTAPVEATTIMRLAESTATFASDGKTTPLDSCAAPWVFIAPFEASTTAYERDDPSLDAHTATITSESAAARDHDGQPCESVAVQARDPSTTRRS